MSISSATMMLPIADSGFDSGSSPELLQSSMHHEEPPMSRTAQYRKVIISFANPYCKNDSFLARHHIKLSFYKVLIIQNS